MKHKLTAFLILIAGNLLFCDLHSAHAQMYWNHAASFSGSTSSYIKCRNSTSLNLTGSFTLEAWINPSTLTGNSKGIISKGGAFGTSLIYAIRLESSGRFIVATNGAGRLRSRAGTIVPVNQWTHIAATYNSTTGSFVLYYNGSADTSVTIAGASPGSNTDTLYFGISGSTTPFSGMMDEIRIWNRALSSVEIRNNMRTSISAFGGLYSGLVMSLTFQTQFSNALQFNLNDWSSFFNTCINNGATGVDLSDVPSETICINQAVTFGGADDYVAGADNPYISPGPEVTLQAWIFPRSNADAVIIHKGTPNGATTNYSLNILNKKISAKINGTLYESGDSLKLYQWSHVAFSYTHNGFSRTYRFFVNGKLVKSHFGLGGSFIPDGTDSLYIGGSIGQPDFNGLIDEIRISRYVKNLSELNDSLFTPMNNNVATNMTSVVYNFDGYSRSNTPLGPNLHFRNNAYMIAMFNPVSPINKSYSSDFQKGFHMKYSGKRIPESGGTGIIYDTLSIFLEENITDINVYVALDHNNSGVLDIDLIAPDGSSVRLFNNNELLTNNESVVTIFDDDAPKSMSDYTYTSFSPKIKPANNLNSIFSGKNSKGSWKLKINDSQNSDTGRVYVWGIQFNNKSSLPKVLSCKNLIQGFYDQHSDVMVRDTVTCYVRSSSSPYAVIASAKTFLEPDGTGSFTFDNPSLTHSNTYYISLMHRNAVETWSKSFIGFVNLTSQASYDFTTDSAKAFGDNMIKVDDNPVKYAIYNGDVNQDGVVDATDAGEVDNAVFNFTTGYNNADVTGDNFVDATDAALVFNNGLNFVGKITP